MYVSLTEKGYLAAGGSTIWGPVRLEGQSTVTLSGNLITQGGTGSSVTHSLEITYDGETWTSSGTTLVLSSAPSFNTSSLSACTAVAVRVRSTQGGTGAVFYACGISISRN